jgi:SagB-type dehydrogenase family enzyme
VREFTDQELTGEEIQKLAWAAQGVTDPAGLRTAPSAGALYPLELYVATQRGCFHYDPGQNALTEHLPGDLRPALFKEALEQEPVRDAPAVFIFTAVYERTSVKYGDRAERYVHLEVGHAAQNLLLEAVALNLGGVPIGAFNDSGVQRALALPEDHAPLYIIPIGHPQTP